MYDGIQLNLLVYNKPNAYAVHFHLVTISISFQPNRVMALKRLYRIVCENDVEYWKSSAQLVSRRTLNAKREVEKLAEIHWV